jgi:hypothetical protein
MNGKLRVENRELGKEAAASYRPKILIKELHHRVIVCCMITKIESLNGSMMQ